MDQIFYKAMSEDEMFRVISGWVLKNEMGKLTDEELAMALRGLFRQPTQKELTFSEYQDKTHSTAVYPGGRALEYLTLGLASEAGEVAGVAKKLIRGDVLPPGPAWEDVFAAEIGDVLWYVSELCLGLNIRLDWVAKQNLQKLESRANSGTLKGSGDSR